MHERQRHNQAIAAARAGMSERTARRLENDPRKPSERQATRGRTVPDPLESVWEPELVPMLETDPSLKPITLLHYLMRSYPESFPDHRRCKWQSDLYTSRKRCCDPECWKCLSCAGQKL